MAGVAARPDRSLAAWLEDARRTTLRLVHDLTDEQLLGPRLAIVNPLLWELGHVAWFQEHWVLQHARRLERPLRDALYDSSRVPHDTRWDLPLPGRAATLDYLRSVEEAVLEGLARGEPTDLERYFLLLSIFHEDMHGEAFTMTRQTLGYPAPAPQGDDAPPAARDPAAAGEAAVGDARIPGGTFLLGATAPGPGDPFVFDNEKWAHAARVEPFAIARVVETQASFAAFVDAGGYARRELWSEAGWRWREGAGATAPVYWRRDGSTWLRRRFDRWVELEPSLPMTHVCWFEADAYCRFAGRRLPTELEWEVAAAGAPEGRAGLGSARRRFPWGGSAPTPERANLDARAGDALDVHACSAGDSAFGCRQMIGNVWEWTASDFLPYAGFSADPYEDYSRPWFGDHKVCKGGLWASRSRMIHAGFRNFYTPDRRDVIVGFRTCAR